VDQGNTGALVRPYSIEQIFLTSDAPGDIRVTVIEIDVQDLSFVYNTSQILQIQGSVTVNEPITVDWSGSPTINSTITNTPAVTISGTPAVTVSGNVEIANDVGNPVPCTTVITGTPAVSISGTPTVTSNQGTMLTIGTQGNAWNAAPVGIAGTSANIDAQYMKNVSAFGSASAATTITIQISQDGTNFYDTSTNVVLAGAGDFHMFITIAARYARLKSSAAATITATLAGKG
jgi:hypothetical protein